MYNEDWHSILAQVLLSLKIESNSKPVQSDYNTNSVKHMLVAIITVLKFLKVYSCEFYYL